VHETLPARPLYALAMRRVLPHAALVVCVSQAALELALRLGAAPSRTRVVHNGVDPRFLAAAGQVQVPEQVHGAGPGPHVGVFGVLEPRKAQHVLLEAAVRLAGRFPEARFWLVGPAALADKRIYADRLRRMAASGPLRGRVALVGFQEDTASWLAAMDVVVQPSVALESFGMALAEAMVLGRPVVASRVGGMPEVVTDEVTGLIVPPGDPRALARALASLLSDPARREELGRQAMSDARARFAPERFCEAMADAYDAALAAGTAPGPARPGWLRAALPVLSWRRRLGPAPDGQAH
jgi:glycosyltransferase involved in cell wall biosynthesis